jgi:hypothetical protein
MAQDECRGILEFGGASQEGVVKLPHHVGLVPRIGMLPQNITQPVGHASDILAVSGDIGKGNPGYKPLTADREVVEISAACGRRYWPAEHPRYQAGQLDLVSSVLIASFELQACEPRYLVLFGHYFLCGLVDR